MNKEKTEIIKELGDDLPDISYYDNIELNIHNMSNKKVRARVAEPCNRSYTGNIKNVI